MPCFARENHCEGNVQKVTQILKDTQHYDLQKVKKYLKSKEKEKQLDTTEERNKDLPGAEKLEC